jgi:hypothetical protein
MLIRYKNTFQFIGLVGFLLGVALTAICWVNNTDFGGLIKISVIASYSFGLIATLSGYISSNAPLSKQKLGSDQKNATTAGSENSDAVDYSSISKKMESIYQSSENNKIKSDKILRELCNGLNASQGALYKYLDDDHKSKLELYSSYAFLPSQTEDEYLFDAETDLVGLAVKEDRQIELNEIPRANFKVFSGLGKTSNASVVIIPVKAEEEVKGAIELSFFGKQDKGIQRFIHDNMSKIGSLL